MNSTPFSVSLSTLSAFTTTCSKRLRTIIDASKHASLVSSEILALSNEVNDLRTVLDAVESNHGAASEHADPRASYLLRRAQSTLTRLDELILSSIKLGRNNELIFQRGAWLRRRTSYNALTQDLRNIKQNIVLLLASQTAVDVRRVRLLLLGVEIPPSTPMQIELEDFNRGPSHTTSIEELPEEPVADRSELPNQIPPQRGPAVNSTYHRRHNVDSFLPIQRMELGASDHRPAELGTSSFRITELGDSDYRPIELDTSNYGFTELSGDGYGFTELDSGDHRSAEPGANEQLSRRSYMARGVDQLLLQNSPQELALPEPSLQPDPLENGTATLRQFDAPEAILATTHTGTAPTSRIRQRQPVVKFHCDSWISCEGYCSCICHSTYRYKSPELLDNLVGSLFIGYTGLPISTPKCDSRTCINQTPRSIRVSYAFPSWFFMKTLDVVARNSQNGPSFGLSLRNRIDASTGINIISLTHNGDITGMVKLLEERKASLTDVTLYNGTTLFCTALQMYQFDTCHFLLDVGYDPHSMRNDHGNTDVQILCRQMLVPRDAILYEHEYNRIFYRIGGFQSDYLEFSHIHKAVTGMIQADIESIMANCDKRELDHRDSQGRTPLHWAALRANVSALKALLCARVDIEAKDYDGKTALHCATISESQRCIELLLIAGSNVLAKDQSRSQPLHLAMMCQNDEETLDILFMAGADVRNKNISGATPLHFACTFNNIDHATVLLRAGAILDEKDNDGDSSLFDSIQQGHAQFVQLLLEHDASIDGQNNHGYTVLHMLALWGTIETIAPFMSCQVELGKLDVEKRNKEGHTAWELLQDRHAPPDGFQEAFEALLARCRSERNDSTSADPVKVKAE